MLFPFHVCSIAAEPLQTHSLLHSCKDPGGQQAGTATSWTEEKPRAQSWKSHWVQREAEGAVILGHFLLVHPFRPSTAKHLPAQGPSPQYLGSQRFWINPKQTLGRTSRAQDGGCTWLDGLWAPGHSCKTTYSARTSASSPGENVPHPQKPKEQEVLSGAGEQSSLLSGRHPPEPIPTVLKPPQNQVCKWRCCQGPPLARSLHRHSNFYTYHSVLAPAAQLL